MIQTPTAFDTMSVLHLLWRTNHIDVVAIKDFLKQEYNLTLTVLANGSIVAKSEDGADKYTID
jgi:hypothetical protein